MCSFCYFKFWRTTNFEAVETTARSLSKEQSFILKKKILFFKLSWVSLYKSTVFVSHISGIWFIFMSKFFIANIYDKRSRSSILKLNTLKRNYPKKLGTKGNFALTFGALPTNQNKLFSNYWFWESPGIWWGYTHSVFGTCTNDFNLNVSEWINMASVVMRLAMYFDHMIGEFHALWCKL